MDLKQAAKEWTEAKDDAVDRLAKVLDCSCDGLTIEIDDSREALVTLIIEGALSSVRLDEVMAHQDLLVALGIQQVVEHGFNATLLPALVLAPPGHAGPLDS